jgi:DNA modification methylase
MKANNQPKVPKKFAAIQANSEADIWHGVFPRTKTPWSIYCGDARAVIGTLPRDHYSCIITSPPYYWQRDYGVVGQIGMEQTVQEYVEAITATMNKVKEVLHPQGVLFLNLGDTYYSGKGQPQGRDPKHNGRRFRELRAVDKTGLGPPKKTLLGMPWRIALAMIDNNWILRSSIIWARSHPVPEPNVRDRPCRTYEFIFLFARNRSYRFKREPLVTLGLEDIWCIESHSQPGREHPAVFPSELVTRCLDLGNPTGGPVLDPFAGSGTVLREALARKMPADGIDLNPAFCKGMVSAFSH